MITVLLEQIIQLLKGWIDKFNDHAEAVEDSLTDLNNTASDIELNTDPIPDIRDNTGAIITPITQIKTNTDSIKTDVTQIKTDTDIIKNNANSISTSAGAAAAFAEDCATNTLNILDKVTTIASDTTQIRADNVNIAADVSSINQALGYYLANTPVTEDVEGEICNFDTDLEDYLQALKVNIPADLTGYSGITLTKNGKNIINDSVLYQQSTTTIVVGQNAGYTTHNILLKKGTYSIRANTSINASVYYHDGTSFRIGATNTDLSFTLNNDTLLSFYLYTSAGITISDVSNIMLEYGNTLSSYEPYKVMTYPISFGSTITDGAEVDLLSGIVKINTSPVTYSSITPIAIRTYKGVNNIYSDIGSMSLTYRETLKHYLDKQQ